MYPKFQIVTTGKVTREDRDREWNDLQRAAIEKKTRPFYRAVDKHGLMYAGIHKTILLSCQLIVLMSLGLHFLPSSIKIGLLQLPFVHSSLSLSVNLHLQPVIIIYILNLYLLLCFKFSGCM